MTQTTAVDEPRFTKLEEIRTLAVIPLYSEDVPNWAGLVGASRATAYSDASTGKVPTVRVGRRIHVPVPALRRMLGDLDAA
ncbi:hypothetical protein [Raineyella sp. LH-20]|uniref:hypothetical protein n=1 Tax=Raineyella sp. LH-20 TaxID=3081204 RepID=UPI002954D3F0|nr:hypothetical protein [Raineyella sp. LH-20]WOP17407.1 hypothetical protein R0146_08940 [Raineyella sp. LH-20]